MTKPLINLLDYFSNDGPSGDLVCLLGRDADGNKVWMDLAKNPHMIVAGTTGSGKSVLLHNIVANLLNYSNCIVHLVDPKNIEFHQYDQLRLGIRVHYTYHETLNMIDSMIELMNHRYEMIRNGMDAKQFPYIVILIDEFADIIMQDRKNALHDRLCRLAQKCRSARISIILATQRPSATKVIKGDIKANFPARIACKVVSRIDSKIILDAPGAELLDNGGDALMNDNTRQLKRFQVAYTDAAQVCAAFKAA